MTFTIYTDGGCSGNRRDAGCPGGFAYILLDPAESVLVEGGGKRENVTNNQMELLAVIEGLKSTKEELDGCHMGASQHDVLVITDSKYVCENFECYLEDWKKRRWRKANGQPVLNQSLWQRLDGLAPEFKSFRFQWVKGHSTNRFNQRADEMVQGYMKNG